MRFVAIDVETANPDYSSICQIGVALFENGIITKTWATLINPEDYFDPINMRGCHFLLRKRKVHLCPVTIKKRSICDEQTDSKKTYG